MATSATARPPSARWDASLAIVALALGVANIACGVRAPAGVHGSARRIEATAPAYSLISFRVDAYHVRLDLDPQATSFGGEIEVLATIAGGGDTFELHGDQLEIVSGKLDAGEATWRLTPLAPGPPAREAMVRLRLVAEANAAGEPAALPAHLVGQQVVLRLAYRGAYRTDDGLFTRRLGHDAFVFSDLEPRGARRMMPIVDRPDVKVPWTVELDVPPGMPAYGNAPERSRTRLANGRDRVAFDPTAPLPSYLFAVAVGPFVEVPVPNAPRPTRFLLPADHAGKVAAAVTVLPEIIRAAEQFVGMPLPYPKLDFIGVPDFNGSAMENPGLVTFDVSALAPTGDGAMPPREPISQHVGIILAHEVAHLWFGDLATPRDWRDLWFNEGFATYVSYRVLDAVFPAWEIGRDKIAARRAPEAIDQLIGAQPVRPASVATPELLFTPITYLKGGAIIETIAAAAGHEAFMTAMREVLLAHEHRNVHGDDVLLAMARVLPPLFGDEAARVAMVTELFEKSGLTEIAISTRCTAANDNAVIVESTKQVVARFPLCLRIGDASGSSRTCLALTQRVEIPTKGCARYALPAGGEGYLRFTLSPKLRQTTTLALTELTPREQFTVDHAAHN
ncbi:MAG: hypothetical protein IPL79_19190 [Myxococcales bacterium]|nr:hypothetical protein [Myxococcales bacterium]